MTHFLTSRPAATEDGAVQEPPTSRVAPVGRAALPGLISGSVQVQTVSPVNGPSPAQRLIRRCRSSEEILKGKTGDDKKIQALKTYADHLADVMLEFQGSMDPELANYDDVYEKVSDLSDNLHSIIEGMAKGLGDVEGNADLIDGITEGFSAAKESVTTKPSAAVADRPTVVTESNFLEASPDGKRAKALGLNGNSAKLGSRARKVVTDSAVEIRSLRQDLLNDAKSGAASVRITEIFEEVRGLYVRTAEQGNDEAVRDFWTMHRHGLRSALQQATESFDRGVTCNEELAQWLEDFLKKTD